MNMLRTLCTGVLSLTAMMLMADDYTVSGQYVTVPVKQATAGSAKVVRLQVVNNNIIRVQATSEAQLPEKQSLIIVPQTAKPKFTTYSLDGKCVCVKAAKVMAQVNVNNGQVTFFDEYERVLLKESQQGKRFWD